MSYLLAIFAPDRDISPIIDCFQQFDVQFQVKSTFERLKPFAENYVAQHGLKVNITKEVESFPDVSERVVISEGGPIDESLIFNNREPVHRFFDGQMGLPRGLIVKKEFENVEEEMNDAPRAQPEFNENRHSRKRKWTSGAEASTCVAENHLQEAAELFPTFNAHLFLSNEDLVEKEVQDDGVGDFDDVTGGHVDNADFMNAVDGYVCPVDGCSMKLSSTYELAGHMKRHSAPWPCGVCQRPFHAPSLLRRHYLSHTGYKPFKCDICEKAFSERRTLNGHRRVHSGERLHKCTCCEKDFIDSYSLSVHMRVHTGERPYKCETCDYRATSSSNLKKHMRTHTGERSYACTACDKHFTQSSSLSLHMRIHTGERPYECDLCDFKASTSGNLKKHKAIHTGKEALP